MSDEPEEDGIYAPGARRLITDALEALDDGNSQQARERLSQAQESLIQSRADELDMSEPLREALEAAVEADDFPDQIPIEEKELPGEWTIDEVDFEDLPVRLDRELRELTDSDSLFRITLEPADRSGESYRLRIEQLDIAPERSGNKSY